MGYYSLCSLLCFVVEAIEENDIVWVKWKGCPVWPAIVSTFYSVFISDKPPSQVQNCQKGSEAWLFRVRLR